MNFGASNVEQWQLATYVVSGSRADLVKLSEPKTDFVIGKLKVLKTGSCEICVGPCNRKNQMSVCRAELCTTLQ